MPNNEKVLKKNFNAFKKNFFKIIQLYFQKFLNNSS